MVNKENLDKVFDLIENGIIAGHVLDKENLTWQLKLKIYRRVNQILRLCLFVEKYRKKNASIFEPLLGKKALFHALYTIHNISPFDAKRYSLEDIVLIFHDLLSTILFDDIEQNYIYQLDELIYHLEICAKAELEKNILETRQMSEYIWREFPIEDTNRLLSEII